MSPLLTTPNVALGLLGLVVVYIISRYLKQATHEIQLLRAAETPIDDLQTLDEGEQTIVRGTVRQKDSSSLSTPMGQRDCVYYRVTLYDVAGQQDSSLEQTESGGQFAVASSSGCVAVDPGAARVNFDSTSGFGPDLPDGFPIDPVEYFDETLETQLQVDDGRLRAEKGYGPISGYYKARLDESWIAPGEDVLLHGTVSHEGAKTVLTGTASSPLSIEAPPRSTRQRVITVVGAVAVSFLFVYIYAMVSWLVSPQL